MDQTQSPDAQETPPERPEGIGGPEPADVPRTGVDALPFADQVRDVPIGESFLWLARGWQDVRRAPLVSLSYAGLFVLIGFVLAGGLYAVEMLYLLSPLAYGFVLVGPGIALGFYQISRDLEEGEKPTLWRALTAWRHNPLHIFVAGLAMLLFLLIWLRFAVLMTVMFFPFTTLSVESIVNNALFTPDGWAFLAASVVVGGAVAGLVFLLTVVALPMMLAERTDVFRAAVISAVTCFKNPGAMVGWAGLIAVFTLAGLALGFLGLVLSLPLIGHATWHAYRDCIRRDA